MIYYLAKYSYYYIYYNFIFYYDYLSGPKISTTETNMQGQSKDDS